nr:hypothetical protein [Tanacetum cinerariifolium]
DGIFISQDKYVAEILKKFGLSEGKLASTLINADKPLLKDSDGEDVDVHIYRSMIGSLMYLTSSRPYIMFAVCACARFQVTLKVSHLNAVKRIFRYLMGKPYLGLWYPKDSPFDLVAYSDSDYAGASLDRKSTTGGCQFLGCRLISWQCKKQTVVATSSTEAEYVATASGCYLRNVVIEIAVLNILSDALPITTNGVNTPRSDEDSLKLMKLIVFLLQKDVCDDIGITAARLSSYYCQANVSAVWLLQKSDAADGFEQIINFLSGSYIHYALTVNHHIYISCIKQFWNSVFVKRSGDVTRLQALVDKKKIVISEAVIREILQLNDAEGVVCLPNEKIFAGLAQMGYEKPFTKLTFYKDFFSSQWKFLIHTILQSLSAKRTSWNEFSTTMASAVICLSKGQRFNFSKYIFDSLVRNVDSISKFYMYPRFIQLIIQAQVRDLSTHTTRFISPDLTQKVFDNIRRVGKGLSGVETPLFEGMLAVRQPAKKEVAEKQVPVDAAVDDAVEAHVAEDVPHDAIPSSPPHVIPSPSQEPSLPPQQQQSSPQAPPQDAEFPTQLQQVLHVCSALSKRVENLETDNAAQKLEIVQLKERVKKLEKANKFKSSKLRRLRKVGTSRRVESSDDMEDVFNQGRMIADTDMNEGIELVKDAEIAESEGRQADKQAEIYNIDLDHSSKVLSMQEDDSKVSDAGTTIPAVSATIPAAIPAVAPTVVAAYTRRRKGVIIRDPEEELSLKTPAETPKVKDKGKGVTVEAPKPMKKKDQIEMDAEYARKLQEEIDRDHDGFNKDVDWDAAMDHVNQKSSSNPQYIKRYQGMKKRPQTESEAGKNMMIYLKNTAGYKMDFFKGMSYADILEDEDDDVFIEATPLASKVLVVDYQIVLIDNKPRWTRCYMEKSKECSWFSIGEKMEAADFMWCSCHYSFNSLALPIG